MAVTVKFMLSPQNVINSFDESSDSSLRNEVDERI